MGTACAQPSGSNLTRYVYFNGYVIEELGESGNVKARNIWGNELLYRRDFTSGNGGYYLYNGHGDVVAIQNSAGNNLNVYEYDIWGNIVSQTEGMSNPFKFAGEIYDEETGYYYLRARYYDPTIGRFISEDTYEGQVDNPLSLNRYTYAHNNPLRYIDPTGNDILEVFLYDKTGYHRYKNDLYFYLINANDIIGYYTMGGKEIYTLIYSKKPIEIAEAITDLSMYFIPIERQVGKFSKIGKWVDKSGEVTEVLLKGLRKVKITERKLQHGKRFWSHGKLE